MYHSNILRPIVEGKKVMIEVSVLKVQLRGLHGLQLKGLQLKGLQDELIRITDLLMISTRSPFVYCWM